MTQRQSAAQREKLWYNFFKQYGWEGTSQMWENTPTPSPRNAMLTEAARHGNWVGAGYGGLSDTAAFLRFTEQQLAIAPIDRFDAFAKTHDIAYEDAEQALRVALLDPNVSFYTAFFTYRMAIAEADRTLLDSVKNGRIGEDGLYEPGLSFESSLDFSTDWARFVGGDLFSQAIGANEIYYTFIANKISELHQESNGWHRENPDSTDPANVYMQLPDYIGPAGTSGYPDWMHKLQGNFISEALFDVYNKFYYCAKMTEGKIVGSDAEIIRDTLIEQIRQLGGEPNYILNGVPPEKYLVKS
jgi:hypothetical protein